MKNKPQSPNESYYLKPIDNLNTGCGLVAKVDILKETIIGSFADARRVSHMDIYSVQIGDTMHIRHWIMDNLNHGCDSNVRLDVFNHNVVATEFVPAGRELTFFYPSTEWAMLRPFQCSCGSVRCIGLVSGAKFLPTHVLDRYHLTPHVSQKLFDNAS